MSHEYLKMPCLIHFRQRLDKKTCFSGIVQPDFMKLQYHWIVQFAGSRRSSCARNHGCESQPLVATRDRTKICRDRPVASRNQRVSIRLRVVTTAALSKPPVASRNL